MISLAWPWILAVLPLPALVYWLLPAATRQEAALRVPFFPRAGHLEGALLSATTRARVRKLMVIATWLALVLAAAQPQWIGDPVQLPSTGRDLMLAVDVSGSMRIEDMSLAGRPASRLATVKQVVGDFVTRRKGDRLGLILFGDKPYLQTPLTFDRNTVRSLLDEAEVGIAGNRTAIGYAIGLAVKHLEPRPEESRVLILLTDGVNTIGDVTPLQAAKVAAQQHIRIHTIGFGADEMIDRSGFFARRVNPSADLDEETLTQIARMTGGRYFRARDAQELEGVYAELDRLEPVAQDAKTLRPVKSLYYWPLGAALLASFLLALLNDFVLGAVRDGVRWTRTALGTTAAANDASRARE